MPLFSFRFVNERRFAALPVEGGHGRNLERAGSMATISYSYSGCFAAESA